MRVVLLADVSFKQWSSVGWKCSCRLFWVLSTHTGRHAFSSSSLSIETGNILRPTALLLCACAFHSDTGGLVVLCSRDK